jgi:hypothetical protein
MRVQHGMLSDLACYDFIPFSTGAIEIAHQEAGI